MEIDEKVRKDSAKNTGAHKLGPPKHYKHTGKHNSGARKIQECATRRQNIKNMARETWASNWFEKWMAPAV